MHPAMSLSSPLHCQAPVTSEVVSSLPRRILAGVIGLIALSVLIVAALLQPAADGFGTHTSMGMKPCSLLERTGVPCPTCGMTTSFAHAADGNLLDAFLTQPAGALLALITAITVLVCTYIIITGANLSIWLQPLLRPRLIIALIGFALIAWIYKIIITV